MKFTLLVSNIKNMLHLKKVHKLVLFVNFILLTILTSLILIGVSRSSPIDTSFEFGISSGDELVFYMEQGNSYNDPLLDQPEKYESYQKYTIGDITINNSTSCKLSFNVSQNITNNPDYENASHWDRGYDQTVILNTDNREEFFMGPFLPLDIGFDDIFTKETFSQMYGGMGIGMVPVGGDSEIIVHENITTFSASKLRLDFEMIFNATIDGENTSAFTKISFILGKNHIIETSDLSTSSTTGNLTTVMEHSLDLVYSNIQNIQTFHDIPDDNVIPDDDIQTILQMTGVISLAVIAVGGVSYIGVRKVRVEGNLKIFESEILNIEKNIHNHVFIESHEKLMVIHKELEILGQLDYLQKIENLMKTCRINSSFLEQKKNLMDKFTKGDIKFAYTGLVKLLKEVNKLEYTNWIDSSVKSEIADSLKKVAGNL